MVHIAPNGSRPSSILVGLSVASFVTALDAGSDSQHLVTFGVAGLVFCVAATVLGWKRGYE